MRLSVQEMLDEAKTSDPAEVDTSFLDAYRRTGVVPQHKVEESAPETTFADDLEFEPALPELPEEALPGPAPETDDRGRDDQRSVNERVNESEPVRSDTKVGRRAGGGSASNSGGTTANPDPGGGAASPSPPVQGRTESASSDNPGHPGIQTFGAVLDIEDKQQKEHDVARDISANRKTDQRDAIQAAGTKGGNAETANALPESGFRLPGAESQPMVRNLPRPLTDAMREQLRSAAVRERGVSDVAARTFSRRLSQPALVMSFLLAHLDVHIETDPATQAAAELFRAQDPLLGSVVERMGVLERLERTQDARLERLQDLLAEVRETSAVIEQAVAYSIADRHANLLRGVHNVQDAPLTHKDAIFIRDKAREETKKRAKFERDRDGRPIR